MEEKQLLAGQIDTGPDGETGPSPEGAHNGAHNLTLCWNLIKDMEVSFPLPAPSIFSAGAYLYIFSWRCFLGAF